MVDFRRLILGFVTPPPSGDAFQGEDPRSPSVAPANRPPLGQNPDGYSQFLRREDETIRGYLTGRNSLDLARQVQSWFVGETPQAREARGNYLARDTALSLTFIAFHDARSAADRRQIAELFLEHARGYRETLRGLGENFNDRADGLLRFSITAGFFLQDLENSGLSEADRHRIQDQLFETLRESYRETDQAIGTNHPDWRHLQELARARVATLSPPAPTESQGNYFNWLREIHDHLSEAQGNIRQGSPYAEEIGALIRADQARIPDVPAEAAIARGFITRMTAQFIATIGFEIDTNAGDSRRTADTRYQRLLASLGEDWTSHPDTNFEDSLNRLHTPEAEHLRGLIRESAVLRELLSEDRNALQNAGSLNAGQLTSRWGHRVIGIVQGHTLNAWENFWSSGEQHLGSYRSILQFFRPEERNPSPLASAFHQWSGETMRRIDSSLATQAQGELASIDSFGFGIGNGLSHFFSVRTAPYVIGGAVLSRLMNASLFAMAGESGELTLLGLRRVPLIRAGEMTRAGHFTSGMLTGTALTLATAGIQLGSDLQAGRPEALSNFGRNLMVGIFVNGAAFSFSAGLTGIWRSRMAARGAGEVAAAEQVTFSRGRIGQFLRRTLPGVGVQAGIGTVGMIGANALVRGVHNIGLPENQRAPLVATDEVVETFLNMAAMNMVELPMMRVATERQLGRFRVGQLNRLASEMTRRDGLQMPAGRERAATNQIFQTLALYSLRGVPMETLRTPRFQAYVLRSVGLEPEAPQAPQQPATPPPPPVPEPLAAHGTRGDPQRIVTTDDGATLEFGDRMMPRMVGNIEDYHFTTNRTYARVTNIEEISPAQARVTVLLRRIVGQGPNQCAEHSFTVERSRLEALRLGRNVVYRVPFYEPPSGGGGTPPVRAGGPGSGVGNNDDTPAAGTPVPPPSPGPVSSPPQAPVATPPATPPVQPGGVLAAATNPRRVVSDPQGNHFEIFQEVVRRPRGTVRDIQNTAEVRTVDLPDGRIRVDLLFSGVRPEEARYSIQLPRARVTELGLRNGSVYRVGRVRPLEFISAEPAPTAVDPSSLPVLLGVNPETQIQTGDLTGLDVPNSTSRIVVIAANPQSGPAAMTTTQGIGYDLPNADAVGGVRTPHGIIALIDADGVGSSTDPARAGRLAVEGFNQAVLQSGDVAQALQAANGNVWAVNAPLRSHQRSTTCATAIVILPPQTPNEPARAQFAWAGDTRAMILRRSSNGAWHWIYRTVDQNLGSLAARQAPTAETMDQGLTMVGIRHEHANIVTNNLGNGDRVALATTSEGEIPDSSHPLGARPAQGFENGVALREGDLVLLASDGFWENFLHTRYIEEMLQTCQTPEQVVQVLTEETHARQDVVRRMLAGELPQVATTAIATRYQFNHRGRTLYIEFVDNDHLGDVYENPNDAVPIDHYKPDNFSLQAYLHQPVAVCAARDGSQTPQAAPASEPARTGQTGQTSPTAPTSSTDPTDTVAGSVASLSEALAFFTTLREDLAQAIVPGDLPMYVRYHIGEGANQSHTSQEVGSTTTRPAAPGPNEIILEVGREGNEIRVRLVDFNRGDLSDETVTALMTAFPQADDLTTRFPPEMQAVVLHSVRILDRVELIGPALRPLLRNPTEGVIALYREPNGEYRAQREPPNTCVDQTGLAARIHLEPNQTFRITLNRPDEVLRDALVQLVATLLRNSRRSQ